MKTLRTFTALRCLLDTEQRSCKRKIRHPNADAAKRAVRNIAFQHGEKMHAYHCRFCGGWHVGHPR